MAERRMFAKSVIDTDKFIELPASARLLYFDLGMRADDDGFVSNPKRIIRMTGGNETDLYNLIENGFLIPFDSGVIVVTHWKLHNYIQKDRYRETIYLNEKSQLKVSENKSYELKNG